MAHLLAKGGISPNHLTLLGLLLSGVVAYLLSRGLFFLGGVLLLLSGWIDLLDGALARFSRQATLRGALLDSVVDRVAEGLVFLGLLAFYLQRQSPREVLLVYVALVPSFLVSYLRARGEGLGVSSSRGVMTRAERIEVLSIGLLLNQVPLALALVALLSVVTLGQRFFHLWRDLRQ